MESETQKSHSGGESRMIKRGLPKATGFSKVAGNLLQLWRSRLLIFFMVTGMWIQKDFNAQGAFHVLKELFHGLGCFFHANSRSTIFSQQL